MTITEIRPFRNGWSVFEALGVEPVFLSQEDAISYAKGRTCFRSGEIRILDLRGAVERISKAGLTAGASQSLIPRGAKSGLRTHIAATESVSSCARVNC